MGRFLRETSITVGLVGIEPEIANKLSNRLTLRGPDDLGDIRVRSYETPDLCLPAFSAGKLDAICLDVSKFSANDCINLIDHVRSNHPRVAICRVAESSFLDAMPGFPEEWQKRFKHYYRLATDLNDADFDEEGGLVRDLFVADSVKTRALGHYVTLEGALIRPRAPMPISTWIGFGGGVVAAITGQFVAYVLREPPKSGDHAAATADPPAAVALAPAPRDDPRAAAPMASVPASGRVLTAGVPTAPPAVVSAAPPPAAAAAKR